MPHPKRRQSKSRKNKRRTHYKATIPQISICSTTNESYLYHRAHWYKNKLYYRGKILLEKIQISKYKKNN